MKCRRHPSMTCLPRRTYCTLDEDWSAAGSWCERDRAARRYEQAAQHLHPGATVRTRRQLDRLARQHHMTFDISTKELMACARNRGKRQAIREQQFCQVTHRLMERARTHITQLPIRPLPRTDTQRALLTSIQRVFA